MELIGNFLSKYSKFIDSTILLKEVVIEVIFTTLGITLTKEDIVYREGVIIIKKSPAVKMEIILHQEELLKAIKDKLPSVVIIKIG